MSFSRDSCTDAYHPFLLFSSNLSFSHETFQEAEKDIFEAVDDLEGPIASLVVLDERETERAASARVVWFMLNKNLARPFVMGVSCCCCCSLCSRSHQNTSKGDCCVPS